MPGRGPGAVTHPGEAVGCFTLGCVVCTRVGYAMSGGDAFSNVSCRCGTEDVAEFGALSGVGRAGTSTLDGMYCGVTVRSTGMC